MLSHSTRNSSGAHFLQTLYQEFGRERYRLLFVDERHNLAVRGRVTSFLVKREDTTSSPEKKDTLSGHEFVIGHENNDTTSSSDTEDTIGDERHNFLIWRYDLKLCFFIRPSPSKKKDINEPLVGDVTSNHNLFQKKDATS
ncbi:uncharacterized protein RAG0_02606 [Rhynchosporium agropyri]|uniref:Uncharacterized protein n=1 Tax=Rhynchosporium agropyri TaxID=914238 RepID=A0A1E1K206_9HELO|nr:uncharacterized protein RAG0_02606 [Rhynchosporium agropyri]